MRRLETMAGKKASHFWGTKETEFKSIKTVAMLHTDSFWVYHLCCAVVYVNNGSKK